jgi:cytochrome P450
MISDPKAMQHVYANSRSFNRQKHTRNLLKMLFGPALGVVDFDDHKRQRKVMEPAFGSPRLRNLFPVFVRHTQKVRPPVWNTTTLMLIAPKLVQLLKRDIAGDSDRQSLQINVYDYTKRVTLDLTGDGRLSLHRLFPLRPLISNSRLRIPIRCSR